VSAPRDGVLVTGGAGYVGSHCAKALLEAGRRLVVLDDLSTGRKEALRFGTFVRGDAGDEEEVRRLLERERIGAVLHFAGRISVEESVNDPAGYRRANVDVTVRLARAAARAGVLAFVFSSSAAVYGTPDRVPIPEDHPIRPVSPYGESKAEAERALAASGLTVACLRYFNAAGAEPEAGLGERHDPETHLIPLAIAAAAAGRPLSVFGTDWPTPDGTCVRDYVHVADLAAAHVAALSRLEAGRGGGTWNLGTGAGASVREVAAAVERAVDKPLRLVPSPRRSGDAPVLVADSTRARADLSWRPSRSGLARVVADAWAFARGGVHA
jgi:UDP-glucose-4-epimerase GalE